MYAKWKGRYLVAKRRGIGIHIFPEMLYMTKEHISKILGQRGKLNMGDSRMITKIHRLTLRQVYVGTIIKLTKMCNDENKRKCEHGRSTC